MDQEVLTKDETNDALESIADAINPSREAPSESVERSEPQATTPKEQAPTGIKPPEKPVVPEKKAVETPTPANPDPVKAAAEARKAPSTWRKEILDGHWATLPDPVKDEVLKRESEIMRGINDYKAMADNGKKFEAVIEPYKQVLNQYNIDPAAHAANLFRVHHTLYTGDKPTRVALLKRIASDIGLTGEDLGLAPGALGEPADETGRQLQSTLRPAMTRLDALEATIQRDRLARVQAEIDAFRSDPQHPYFDEVADDIAMLIPTGRYKGLKEAYDAAVYLNPVTRAKLEQDRASKLQADQQTTQVSEAESRRAAAAATAASSTLTTRSRSADTRTKPKDWQDGFDETVEKIFSRAN